MAGKHSYTCPHCGVTKSGYYLRDNARNAAAKHIWKRHGIDITKHRGLSR